MSPKTPLYAILAATGLTFCPLAAHALVNVGVQPASQTTQVGGSAQFTAQITTTTGEVITGILWQFSTNGLNPFITVPGATNTTCNLINVQTTDAGFYFAKVTYSSGSTTGLVSISASVQLIVQDQARITSQPVGGLIRIAGTNVSFSVGALGAAPLTYQWRQNGNPLTDNGRIAGSSAATLSLNNLVLTDTGNYVVVVTNQYAAVTSQVASLTVLAPPGIGVPPQNQTVITGSNATFTVTATGTAPFGYRWQKNGVNLSNGGRISGATTNTLLISGALTNDNGNYRVVITNNVGSITSDVATLTVLVPPTITSASSALWRQGLLFTFTVTATGSTPITFGASGLPNGLSIAPTNGVISGIPAVTGVFNITLYATNAALTRTGLLVLTLTTGVPGITSALAANGKQGQMFNYTIVASNTPAFFTASGLPAGVNLDPITGIISGPPIVSGIFPVTITAGNIYGTDTRTLTLNIASSVPVITSSLTATGTEYQPFSYAITATDSPTLYGAANLPLGLTVDTNSGAITGSPLYGGTFNVLLSAANAWGTGTNTLQLAVGYAPLNGTPLNGTNLVISLITNQYSSPYLLDFSFSLRDESDPQNPLPVVRPPSQLQVVCMETTNFIPIDKSETAFILQPGLKKAIRMFIGLDYTYSMFSSPGAIPAMEAAAKTLIYAEPPHAQFGIYEFNADYMDPQLVTTNVIATNGLSANKTYLSQAIDGIQTNFVQGNYAGTRCWDMMYTAINKFGAFTSNNVQEQRYLVVMSDGNDDSSYMNTNADPVQKIIDLAVTNQVRIYCVAFGPDINVGALERLTTNTLGHYYPAATTADLGLQFLKIAKDIDGQYLLRWATLRRAPQPFQPSFSVTVDGVTAFCNTNLSFAIITNIGSIDTNQTPPVTNYVYSQGTNIPSLPFNPTQYTGDVRVGSLQLVSDPDVGPQITRLRAFYVPRSIPKVRVTYQPTYPCVPTLASSGPGQFLNGWSLTDTTDTNGVHTLTIMSPNPANLLTSMPYGIMGDLVTFNFQHAEFLTVNQAFRSFTIDNSIYTNGQPSGTRFVLQPAPNGSNFINSALPPTPPHGTPVPWLNYYGFTSNLEAAELSDPNGNGLAVWQEYLAGLNPTNASSTFGVRISAPPLPPQITFDTVVGRTYRIDTATTLENWMTLRDFIEGVGGPMTFIDYRNLGGVNAVYYRVAVY